MVDLPILDLIPALSPTIKGRQAERPEHLAPLVDELEQAIDPHDGQRFFWFSVPPRHWKSETLKHAAVKHILRWPDEGVAYCTHTGTFACKQSRSIRKIAQAAGLRFAQDSNRQDEWELAGSEGGLVARGMGGELTGRGFRLILIDDPIKSREDAESPTIRQKTWDWIQDDVLTRLSPDGVAILVHTRWHPDDPIGRARKGDTQEWHGTNLPALSGPDETTALLPHIWSVEQLQRIRDANELRFASLFQGRPRPRGGAVFGAPHWYQPGELPRAAYRIGHGIDLASSSKTWADRSVRITGWKDRRGFLYLVDAEFKREPADTFAERIVKAQKEHPGPARWYFGGMEKAVGQFLSSYGCHLNALPATSDKFVRAQPAAAAWNRGFILLPATGNGHQLPWVSDLLDEVSGFTGLNDKHDDIVDALAALVDEMGITPIQQPARHDNATPLDQPYRFSELNDDRWGDDAMGFG